MLMILDGINLCCDLSSSRLLYPLDLHGLPCEDDEFLYPPYLHVDPQGALSDLCGLVLPSPRTPS